MSWQVGPVGVGNLDQYGGLFEGGARHKTFRNFVPQGTTPQRVSDGLIIMAEILLSPKPSYFLPPVVTVMDTKLDVL